jgi:uncharacterized protein
MSLSFRFLAGSSLRPFAVGAALAFTFSGVVVACGSSVPDRPSQAAGGANAVGGSGPGAGGTVSAEPNGGAGGTGGGEGGGDAGGAGGEPTLAPATRRDLVVSVAACVQADYQSFSQAADGLVTATAALAETPSAEARTAARAAFQVAMDQWQLIEALAVGPLATLDLPGGQDLRDPVHPWPLVSRCGVEQLLVSKAYEAPGYVETSLVNTRGLASLEYLLFYEGEDNECSAAASLNSQGTWAALPAAERSARKATFAHLLALDVKKRADLLVAAWSPDGGHFGQQLATAGEGSTVYDTLPKAVNALSDALFYVEFQVKDRKLARPIGLMECEAATCPEKAESRFAHRDLAYIRQNLVAFRRALTGCAVGPAGFADVLVGLGAGDLADRLLAAVDEAITVIDTFPAPTFRASLLGDKAPAIALHTAVKKLTDLLKTELVGVLDLELPKRVEGDND